MSYLVLKDTVRIKKAAHGCRVIEITTDSSKDVPPIIAYMLSLCNGMTDDELITRCMAVTWGLTQERATEVFDSYTDALYLFLERREEPELVQTRYKMEDYAYRTTPLAPDMRWETPANTTLILTEKCNFTCTYCYNDSGIGKRKSLTTGQWLDAVEQLLALDVTKFTLTGGEPMLHPGFFQILERVMDGGALAYICTNGSLIDEAAVKRFVDIRQPGVQISLDSAIPEIHHKLTCSRDSFSKVTRAIELMAGAGIKVNVKGMILPETYRDAPKLIDLCARLGASVLVLDCYDICSSGRGDPGFLVTDEMADEVEKAVFEARERPGMEMVCNFIRPKRRWKDDSNIVMCASLTEGLAIRPDGEYTLCDKTAGNPNWCFGFFPQVSVEDFWKSPEITKRMRPDPSLYDEPCRTCEHIETCRSGCHANKQFVTDRPYAADPCCWQADYENNPF